MITKTIFSGFGGQGVLMMGYSLAMGAMHQGFHVTFLPSYGAEMRGGTANCTVSVGDEEIASPIASEPDNMVAMNAPSLFAFQSRVDRGGRVFTNSSIVKGGPSRKDLILTAVPCNTLAEEIGNPRGANMVMMGAFIAVTKMIDPDGYLRSMEQVLGARKKAHLEANRRAFERGLQYAAEAASGG